MKDALGRDISKDAAIALILIFLFAMSLPYIKEYAKVDFSSKGLLAEEDSILTIREGVAPQTYIEDEELDISSGAVGKRDRLRVSSKKRGSSPQCSDGLDNDKDGSYNYPKDFGCESLSDNSEVNNGNTHCSDGLDNDGDGKIDQFDLDCENRVDNTESSIIEDRFPVTSLRIDPTTGVVPLEVFFSCSTIDGDAPFTFNIDFKDGGTILQSLNENTLTGKYVFNAAGEYTTSCSITDQDGDKDTRLLKVVVSLPSECSDGIDNDLDGLIDYPLDPDCTSPQDNDESAVVQEPPASVSFVVNPTFGNVPLKVAFSCSTTDNDSPYTFDIDFKDGGTISQNIIANKLSGEHTYQSIGQYDAGCIVTDKNGEAATSHVLVNVNSQPLPQCSDGIDNDGDGSVDYPADFGCIDSSDSSEINNGNTQCSDGIDNDGDGKIDQFDLDCSSAIDNDEWASVVDKFPNVLVSLAPQSGEAPLNVFLNCTTSDGNAPFTYRIDFGNGYVLTQTVNRNYFYEWNTYNSAGTYSASCKVTDSDGDFDTKLKSVAVGEKPQPQIQCSDGLDNDADGSIDFPADFGCIDSSDNSELNNGNTQCSDGVDNDGDGKIDQKDLDCQSRDDNSEQSSSPAPPPENMFSDDFNVNIVIEESGSMSESLSPYWWVNSGAYLISKDGLGMTVQGELPSEDRWRLEYASSNPEDTDNGYHPQNIFRLVTRTKWQNLRQETYFRITKDQLSSSINRQGYNALLFFNRYKDGNNLYYTGIRTDGAAVIKKKIGGTYYTMAYKKIFSGTYNRDTNPSLLPKNTWIGLRSEVVNNADSTLSIKLYMDNGRTGNWQLILEVADDGKSYGGAIISSSEYAGIRTDFMDVQFDDYSIRNF